MNVVDIEPYDIYSTLTVKDSIPAQHVKDISDLLVETILEDDKPNRLTVSQPPRTAKSSLITLSFPFWLIFIKPELNILIVNYSQSLADDFGMKLRQLFVDQKEFLAMQDIYLSDKQRSKSYFMFENHKGELLGSIKLVGVGGAITGRDVDVCIADDLIKGFSDCTPTLLEKLYSWFQNILVPRLEPHSKLILLGTRWATGDIIGRLQEEQPDKYKFVNIKALNDDGTCIWKERYTPKFFKERQAEVGERVFQAQYQGQPLDEQGAFFQLDNLLFDTFKYHHNSICVRSWDLAYSDESKGDINDYSASIKMWKSPEGLYWITDLKNGQYGENIHNELKRTAYLDTPNTPILIETGTKGGASKFYFNDLKNIYLRGYNVKQSEPVGSKVDRALAFRDAIWDGKVVIDLDEEKRESLIKQLNSFPLGKHDDIIDACSYAYNYLQDKKPIVKKLQASKKTRVKL